MEGGNWVRRLHGLSSLALELWPAEAPHWRVAGQLVVPPTKPGSLFAQELSTALAVREPGQAAATRDESPADPGWQGLDPAGRAACLRALCALRGGKNTPVWATSLLSVMVDKGGVIDSRHGLAHQLSLEELRRCIVALSESGLGSPEGLMRDASLKRFVQEGAARLASALDALGLRELHELQVALRCFHEERPAFDEELRRRLRRLAEVKQPTAQEAGGQRALHGNSAAAVVACAQSLGEDRILRSEPVRMAQLPAALDVGTAAEVLLHALPREGALASTHEFVVAMATRQIASGARQMSPPEIGKALHGVLMLQARGEEFTIQQAAVVLRALWPRVALRLPHLGHSDLSAAMRAYWWQLQYSRQEFALTGVARDHPIADLSGEHARLARGASMREVQAMDELRAKLLRPVLARLGELPLREVSACLTALAQPVRPPDALVEEDRAAIREAVTAAFPAGPGLVTAKGDEAAWWPDFWAGEVQSLSPVELLELACGLREAASEADWVLASLKAELSERLKPVGRAQPPVELSHFLLLRLCRCMDLWQDHVVESVLRHLLGSPEAVKPLPSTYFVAVLSTLSRFSVPKELPLRLVASFLDRVDRGERVARPEHWADLLCAIRPLDEPPSWERVTPRLIQQLVPHLGSLPPDSLMALLRALAGRPSLADVAGPVGPPSSWAPMDRLPQVVASSVRQVMDSGHWELPQVVEVFHCLANLGWYDEGCVAAILTHCVQTPLLEPHAQLLLPLVRSCVELRVHHAPLLHKVVQWYCWCYAYLRPKPLPQDQLDELLDFSEQLLQLSFQSLELAGILTENLKNPNASPRQVLALLSALARFSHFPAEFKEACSRACAGSSDSDLAALTTAELINAFNIHLCAVFDGPAALKHWLTEDAQMKSFFQVHTSQKWYQRQDQERTTFLQSPAYTTLRQAAEKLGLDLKPSDPGEVYHIELASRDAKQRLSTWSNNPPTALVCVKSKEQLRWYVPVSADGSAEADQMQNRCHSFRFMFRGAVQKLRHLQAMGYRPAIIWMSEWNGLTTTEQRLECLGAAVGLAGQQSAAFSPATPEEVDLYA